jgi:hypothetical protein
MAEPKFDESVVWNLFQSFAVNTKDRLEPVLSPFEFTNLLHSIGITLSSEKQLELVFRSLFSNNPINYSVFQY